MRLSVLPSEFLAPKPNLTLLEGRRMNSIISPNRLDNLHHLAEVDRLAFRDGINGLLEEVTLALDYQGFQTIKQHFGAILIRESPLYIDLLNQLLLQMSRSRVGSPQAKPVVEFILTMGDINTLDILNSRQRQLMMIANISNEEYTTLKKTLQSRIERIEKLVENLTPADVEGIHTQWKD